MALATVFDLVRDVNTAMDRGTFLQQDAPRLLATMEKFDEILSLLPDDDNDKLSKLGFGEKDARMPAEQIEALSRRTQRREAPPRLQTFGRNPQAPGRFWYHPRRYEGRHRPLEI